STVPRSPRSVPPRRRWPERPRCAPQRPRSAAAIMNPPHPTAAILVEAIEDWQLLEQDIKAMRGYRVVSEIAKLAGNWSRRNPMADDDWDQEYHLTPRGWMTGSAKHYGRVGHEAPRPPDAVETWEQHTSEASGWSREIRMQRLI